MITQAKLTAEIEELKNRSAARKQTVSAVANDFADVSMEGPSISDTISA